MSLIFLFIIGLAVGSFLNVVIDRLPQGKSIFFGRSQCDHCQHDLSWYDLIPILSFFHLAAKCRYCRKKISWQYPIVELVTGMLFVITYSLMVQTIELSFYSLIYYLIVIAGLIVIFFTDLKYRIIPDQILALMSISTMVFLFVFNKNQFLGHLLAALILFLVFISLVLLTRGRGMGLGDVKFAAVMGFLLGFPKVVVSFYLSFLTGAVVSLILVMMGRKTMKSTIPFGPFLAGSTVVSIFFGDRLWNIFRKVIGL